MATFYPPHPRTNATRGERRVLDLLKGLDDNWYVLHSLEFVLPGHSVPPNGEADFVLLHRIHGILVLEVKDGQYRVDKRRWTAVRRDGTEVELTRDPFQQAKDNRFALSNLIRERTGIRRLPIGQCVLFTDGRPSAPLGLNGPEEIVLTLASLDRPGPAIRAVIDHWQLGGWTGPDDFQTVVGTLCPEAVIAPSIGYTIDVAGIDLEQWTALQIEWTTEQLNALAVMSRGVSTLVVGAAGTGKTVIAQERARRLAADGALVALVGQDRQLRIQLRRRMSLNRVVCGDPADVLATLYGPEAFAPFAEDPPWVAALALSEEKGRRLDHLIIDEAQNHDADLLEALKSLVRPDGTVLLLADPYQKDSTGSWKPPGNYDTLPLTRNCRNVHPIAKLVARLGGGPTPDTGPSGSAPIFTEGKDIVDEAVAITCRLLAELTPNRIVILTETIATQRSVRMALLRAKIDASVVTRLGEPGLLVSTVNQFRGCEAEAIVYLTERPTQDDRTIDYIAVSRACAFLHILGPRARWANVAYLLGEQS
jgi:hypothetical protein